MTVHSTPDEKQRLARPTGRRTPPALRVWEHQLIVYRRIWFSNVTVSLVRPLLYVVGMGFGVGALVDDGPRADEVLGGLSYFQFFAPAVIATSAMMVLANDSLWPIRGGFIWTRTFFAQASTPLSSGDIVAGLGLWHATKGMLASAGVALVLVLFPTTRTWGLVPAMVFGALTGVAFAAPLTAWAAWRETDLSFANINRFVIVPMFLFSGAFYPIDQLPVWLQWFSRITPVWHGVELCREAVNGDFAARSLATMALHTAYLALWALSGWLLARKVFSRRLGG